MENTANRRGRPRTATPEKRRADTAVRVAKYRRRQKVRQHLADLLAQEAIKPSSSRVYRSVLLDILALATGASDHDADCYVDYLTPDGKEGSKSTTYSGVIGLIEEGNKIVLVE